METRPVAGLRGSDEVDLQGINETVSQNSDAFRFNQLKARMQKLSFRKSEIHGWGLYAEEPIDPEEMVVEYKGELISNKVSSPPLLPLFSV